MTTRGAFSRLAAAVVVAGGTVVMARQAPAEDPTPQTLEAFQQAAAKVLADTGVPGAGIALVRAEGIEWAGGVGFADRDARTPVTADTHFRVGSISKTFVAMALVQLSEDGDIDLDTPVAEIVPDVDIDNPWNATDPVRVIHLLQHTAGFDDMHYDELYNVTDPPEMPLHDVLARNPRSRVVRWRPGTRMSYSNPGYTVAGYVLEKAAGRPYEQVINERIFLPTGMPTSSFTLSAADQTILARGYDSPRGPPVPFTPIYLRPSGNLHSTAGELARFVRLLLNWGELGEAFVIDPEYLGSMEQPRTTLASHAGLRRGYGTGIAAMQFGGFPLLGHSGGIEGFSSLYAYSPARDVGFVILLNGAYAAQARVRLASLAIRYLKRDVEPPPKPSVEVPPDQLRRWEGYYHPASPRNQALWFVDWLSSGLSLGLADRTLRAQDAFFASVPLAPVSESLFRLEADIEATRVLTTDESGGAVMAGPSMFMIRTPRWRVEIVRWPVLLSLVLLVTPLAALIVWIAHARWATPAGFWGLKLTLLLCTVALAAPVMAFNAVQGRELGLVNQWTATIYVGSIVFPIAALLATGLTVHAWRRGAGRWLLAYAWLISVAALIVSAYLASWGVVGFKTWDF